MKSGGLPTPSEFSTQHAQRRIRVNASDLRRLAEKFDRIADDLGRVPAPGLRRAGEVAGQIIHEHAVWLMNAQLHVAVQYAAEADLFREEDD